MPGVASQVFQKCLEDNGKSSDDFKYEVRLTLDVVEAICGTLFRIHCYRAMTKVRA